jgi:hypothetical protein
VVAIITELAGGGGVGMDQIPTPQNSSGNIHVTTSFNRFCSKLQDAFLKYKNEFPKKCNVQIFQNCFLDFGDATLVVFYHEAT